jgi:hypothetical protein
MQHQVTTEAELEAIYGLPAGPAVYKEIDHISEHYRALCSWRPVGPSASTARRAAIRRVSAAL